MKHKSIMITVVATLIVIAFLAGIWAMQACLYPRAGFIRAIEYDTNLMYIEDPAGLIWIVENPEDFWVEDNVAMLMFNNFTPNTILDDVIVDIR